MLPNIQTPIPHPEDVELLKSLSQYEPLSMQNQLPVVWDKAIDSLVYDRWGNIFIDFTSTICVTNTGHGNPEVCEAIKRSLDKPLLHSYNFGTEIRFHYLRALTKYTGFEKAFLTSAGTEATEVACKIMRLATNKPYILSFTGAMHGKTMLAEQLKGVETWCGEGDIVHLEFPPKSDTFSPTLFHGYEQQVAGIIIESYRGWNAQFFDKRFIQNLAKYCLLNNMLMCFDEIQSGFGRTGKLFAFEHYNIRPDLVCCGKGLGGGVPISAVLGDADLLDVPEDLSSTHSANPLVCAAGLANIDYLIKNRLVEKAARQEVLLEEGLKKLGLPYNCKGLVGAIMTDSAEQATQIVFRCLQKGLLLIWTHRNSIKIAPPLTISDDLLLKGLEILKEAI